LKNRFRQEATPLELYSGDPSKNGSKNNTNEREELCLSMNPDLPEIAPEYATVWSMRSLFRERLRRLLLLLRFSLSLSETH